jgi:DnaK suppressor protein
VRCLAQLKPRSKKEKLSLAVFDINIGPKKFQMALETHIADLERDTRHRDQIAIEQSPDHVEDFERASERDIAISNIDRQSRLLQNGRAALLRIHEGSFGVCEDCEEQISSKRLSAVPWAARCVAEEPNYWMRLDHVQVQIAGGIAIPNAGRNGWLL